MKRAASNCEEARQAWHLGLEAGQANDALAQHLRQCRSCADYVADLERIAGALAELKEETAGVDSLHRSHRAGGRRGLLRFSRIAAALALVVGLYGVYLASVRQRADEDPAMPAIVVTNDHQQGTGDSADEVALGITLQGTSAQNLLAVASPTANPDVQLYWLYPRLDAAAAASP